MTTKYYSSADSGAPVFAPNVPGSLIAILDAVLVNGYGSKSSLGWTIEYTDSNTRVYRNSTSVAGSTGMYLYVDDSNTSKTNLKAYKTMSDINTGTDQIPPSSTFGGKLIWYKDYDSTTGYNKNWSIIGDERTFYIGWQKIQSSSDIACEVAGDFISYVPSNSFNYCLSGHPPNTSSSSYLSSFFSFKDSSKHVTLIPRSQSLITNTITQINDISVSQFTSGNGYEMSTYSGIQYYTPMVISEYSTADYPGTEYITGELRGVKRYLNKTTPASIGRLWGTENGMNLYEYCAASNSYGSGSILISDSNWS